MNRKLLILDAVVLAGGGIAGVGLWMAYPPAALIITGLAIAGLAIFQVKGPAHDRRRNR